LFSSEGKKGEAETDKLLRSAVARKIGPKRNIEFYMLTFVSWKNNELIVNVGGTSSDKRQASGPMELFCFAASIDSDSGQVLSIKKQPESRCRTDP